MSTDDRRSRGSELEQTVRMQGAMLAQVSDAIVAVDTHLRVIYCNAAAERLYRFPAAQALGRPLADIYRTRWPSDEVRQAAYEAAEQGVWRGEVVQLLHDGRVLDVSVASSQLADEQGRRVGFIATIRDITAQKREEELRAAAQRSKDEFLSRLAHELRNPLAPIRNATYLLQSMGAGLSEEAQQAREMIERHVNHLARIVDELLAVLREGLESGRGFPLRPSAEYAPVAVAPELSLPSARPAALRVLIVDDNVDAASSLAMVLELWGHKVCAAYDGPTALEEAARFAPHVVLLDIGMPGMDGHEVARRMRQMPQLRGVTLVAQTGWGQEEDRRRTQEAGFDHHIVKPLDPLVLESLLAEIARG